MTQEFQYGDRVVFCVDDALRDGALDHKPGEILEGRFLYINKSNLPADRGGLARVELNEVIDWDDDGLDDDGAPIMRPIYARYHVPLYKLTGVTL